MEVIPCVTVVRAADVLVTVTTWGCDNSVIIDAIAPAD